MACFTVRSLGETVGGFLPVIFDYRVFRSHNISYCTKTYFDVGKSVVKIFFQCDRARITSYQKHLHLLRTKEGILIIFINILRFRCTRNVIPVQLYYKMLWRKDQFFLQLFTKWSRRYGAPDFLVLIKMNWKVKKFQETRNLLQILNRRNETSLGKD